MWAICLIFSLKLTTHLSAFPSFLLCIADCSLSPSTPQVLSGDAITIRNQPRSGRPKERQLNLSNVTAPRPARRGPGNSEATADEPGAWASREFLRKKLVGKEVLFTIETSTPTGREYGHVYLATVGRLWWKLTETLPPPRMGTI